MNEQSAFIINEESHEKILKENEEEKRKELKRKKTNARQRAYYQRQKDLKKNKEKIIPKSNAERQRKFRQHNAEKSYMDIKKRQKLCSNEENIVQSSAVENIENVTLQENQFHSQQLHIYEQRNECITPEVILHRNTGIPGDETLTMAATNIPIEETTADTTQDITFKEEFTPHIEEHLEVKFETDEIHDNMTENPYEETELHIKDELMVSIEQDDSQSSTGVADIKDEIETESILPTSPDDEEVKLEMQQDENSVVSYDFPNYDENIDSREATALSNVEACLSDDINIKAENYVDDDNHKDFPRVIKDESELTVTETHLISNKLINTTSTITNSHDGIIESQTTNTLIMEIHPMTQENQALKMGNPEEILPTTNETYEHMDEPFQLNSITGNILTLEQEAYGLLKTKKKSTILDKLCPKCPKTFTTNRALSRHLKCHTSLLDKLCPKCPKAYSTKSSLNIHLKVHATIEKREKGVLKGIQKRLENKKKIKKEFTVQEEKPICDEENEPIKTEEKEGYKCTCGQVFKRRSRMETCLRSHTDFEGTSSYDCPTCDKKFNSKDLLISHRQRNHRKKYPCKFCPTDYHTQKELFKHLQLHQKVQLMEYKVISEIAKGNQELKCLLCDKTCSKLSDLKTHIMEGHKEPYKCPHCNHKYTKIVDFANHIKKTHPNVGSQSVIDVLGAFSKLAKAWKCENCGKQFLKADKLALHQVEEHTPDMKNEQHFQCGDCQRVFVSKCGLNSHMRMHHRTESTEEPEPAEVGVLCLECRKVCQDMNALTSHMRLHSMDRKYPCKYCDFRFATPQKRKAHAEIHTGDMKYVCFICEYTCSSENRLKQHKMSVKHISMKEYLLTGKPLEEEQSTSKKQKIKDTLRKKEWGVKKKKKERKDEEGDIACDICGENFTSESEMQEHKQTHPFIEFPNDDKPSRIFFK